MEMKASAKEIPIKKRMKEEDQFREKKRRVRSNNSSMNIGDDIKTLHF
jgi:hypothetical protein